MRVGADSVVAVGWKSWDVGMTTAKDASESNAAIDLEASDDRALVSAFQAGRREAFDELVRRHQRQIFQLCYRYTSNQDDAADLAQDVFVRAFKGLRNFKGESAVGTWLYRVGVNACLNRIAVKRPVVEPIEAAQHVDAQARDPLDEVVRGERAAAVREAIAQLPPKQRATLMLRVYDELSHDEIAKILGSSVGAVKANFFHALGNLRRVMKTRP